MEKRERPNWDESFMFSALWAATRSSCKYLQTGAVIVRDKRIIASGYNGAPPGIKNCLEVDCRKDREGVDFHDKGKSVCRGIHAEINALSQIAREDVKGATLYTVHFPCTPCAKAITGNGIAEVVYCFDYKERDSLTTELFEESHIRLRKITVDLDKCFSMLRGVSRINVADI